MPSSSWLDGIRVASPCTESWEGMSGDARQRLCGKCQLNVFNLSAMPRDKAEAFVRSAQGRVCVRLYRRKDGTVLTRDCPVGLAAARQTVGRAWARLVAVVAFAFAAPALQGCERRPHVGSDSFMRKVQPFKFVVEKLDPEPEMVMGLMEAPAAAPVTPAP